MSTNIVLLHQNAIHHASRYDLRHCVYLINLQYINIGLSQILIDAKSSR